MRPHPSTTFCPFQYSSDVAHGTARLERKDIPALLREACEEGGQDVAEYAIMLAVVLVLVMGMVRLIGANASTVFSQVASGIQ